MPITLLTLLVPELLWPEPEDREALDNLECPALATLLARSRLKKRPPQSPEASLADMFGHAPGAPYGAFRQLGENSIVPETDGSGWIAADPVHLRYHQERLVLADGSTLGITEEDAKHLAEELNRYFPDMGRIHVAAPDRWYIELAQQAVLTRLDAIPPLSTVAGRSIDELLQEITQDRAMRGLLNEIQTFLHAHPVNRRRESAGLLPINSLWLWGAGSLPPRIESDFDGVWSTDPLARGLARAAGVPTHPQPVDAESLFKHTAPDTRHLVVLEDLLGPVQYENGDAYRTALASLEARWFAPLQRALASGTITHLRIEATTAYAALSWESRRIDLWRFWRGRRPLADIAKTMAKDSR